MTRTIILLICVFIACADSNSGKVNRLATEMNAFLVPGTYDVRAIDLHEKSKSSKRIESQVILSNDHGRIAFKGMDSFGDLDSIQISLTDSTLVRQFSVNPYMDTVSVSADKSGIDENYIGYAFGRDNTGGIAAMPEFRQFFNKDNISGSQFLFIVGTTKSNEVVIRRIERVVSSGEILMDINKCYILTLKSLR